MKTIRTATETRLLAAEAERRARAGEALAAIASSMGIPASTLSDWARLGGWRRKDLEEERTEEIVRLTAERIAAMRRSGLTPLEIKSADGAGLRPGPDDAEGIRPANAAEPRLEAGEVAELMMPEFTALSMAKVFLERGLLDEADKAIRLARRFADFNLQIERRILCK